MAGAGGSVQTVLPTTRPIGFFSNENVCFIQGKIAEVLGRRYAQKVIVDRASIIRVMQRVIEQFRESIPRMNERAVMVICNEFMNHQDQANKHLNWEEGYYNAHQIFNPDTNVGHSDVHNFKFANRLGEPAVGGTARFYFT